MQLGPDLRTGTEYQQPHRLTAVAQGQHKQPRAAILPAGEIADHGAGPVVNLAFFPGPGLNHRTGFRRLCPTTLAHKALDALIAAREAVGVHQVLPDRLGVAASRECYLDRLPVGLAGTRRGTAAGLRLWRWLRPAPRLDARVGGHLIGRFCG